MNIVGQWILRLAFLVACFLPGSALSDYTRKLRLRKFNNLTCTLRTHRQPAPQVPQTHQEEAWP